MGPGRPHGRRLRTLSGNQVRALRQQPHTGVAIIGDIARKVDVNIDKEIMPGLYYDLESMRRALIDIKSRADHVLPTHDWSVLDFGKSA